ncbi:MAG: hypothetical protein ABI538_02570 [Pseudoxanthomonas sp.]
MSAVAVIALLVASLGAPPASASMSQPAPPAKEASLHYIFRPAIAMGISYGITAVDGQAPLLDEQASARISSGLRTVGYYCPNESQPAGGASLSFNFQPGQAYELV